MPLITTPAATDANSYASVAEADAYCSGHLYALDWTNAAPATKEVALVMACRLLDAAPRAWTGAASTATQALGWPRTGMLSRNGFAIASGEVPATLKNAQAEYARQLLAADLTATNDVVAQGLTSFKAGPVSAEFKASIEEDAALARRWALEFQVPDAVIALLVPSWLLDPRDQDAPWEGFLIESL